MKKRKGKKLIKIHYVMNFFRYLDFFFNNFDAPLFKNDYCWALQNDKAVTSYSKNKTKERKKTHNSMTIKGS